MNADHQATTTAVILTSLMINQWRKNKTTKLCRFFFLATFPNELHLSDSDSESTEAQNQQNAIFVSSPSVWPLCFEFGLCPLLGAVTIALTDFRLIGSAYHGNSTLLCPFKKSFIAPGSIGKAHSFHFFSFQLFARVSRDQINMNGKKKLLQDQN